MEFTIEELKLYIPLIKDLAIAIAAVITSSVAVYGVRLWKRELVGKKIYEVAKNLVHQSHVMNRASCCLRYPVWENEKRSFTHEEIKHTTKNERWMLAESEAYKKRIEVYSNSLSEFSESLLQARILIGSKTYESFLPFQKALRDPIDLVNEYLTLIYDQTAKPYPAPDSDKVLELQSLLYSSDNLDDELTQRIADTREDGERFLLPYLHRRSIYG